ncbi:uncharacterized protein LOC143177534 isoform X2 [Calliopsis andreniformis]|uniref:uncharacterized protein LOC143177534 isoform X2 n=1 Tax=Calliopsis andreniformis TaxID=337506 RepID=UPI003FCD3F73
MGKCMCNCNKKCWDIGVVVDLFIFKNMYNLHIYMRVCTIYIYIHIFCYACYTIFTTYTYIFSLASISLQPIIFKLFICLKSYLKSMEANCECQYTVTLTDEVVQKRFSETKDNFNFVPSIHEVYEEESDEESVCDQETRVSKDSKQNINATEDVAADDSLYGNESFCSDESYDESEDTNIRSKSFDDSHFSHEITSCKCNKEGNTDEGERLRDTVENHESINSVRCKSSTSEDKFGALKQIKSKRKNMSFTDEEIRKIEWENQLLLKKIMAQQKPKDKLLRNNISQPQISSSAINRKKLQKKIENENILLLQRIQQTKSRVGFSI